MANFDELQCYTRGEQRRCTTHTAIASFLEQTGWVIEGEKDEVAPQGDPIPEIPVEVGVDAFDIEPEEEREEDGGLEGLTKAELIEFAAERGVELKSNISKAKALDACLELI